MIRDATKTLAAEVEKFLALVSQIGATHRVARNLYSHRFAPDYTTFDFIEPDEIRLSKIIAWFLNPRQTHGQGGLFLRLFIESLGVELEPVDCGRASVRTEASIRDGRLDILVTTTSIHLTIENKPWAGDQDKQLERYFAYFDSLGRSPHYKVIYLTSKGIAPPEHSISEAERDRRIEAGQLRLWGYDKEVLAWLARCRAECRADRVVTFIDEFSRYIRMTFEGVSDRTMSDDLLDKISASTENVSAAMQVILMADSIRKRLLADLRQQLLLKMPGRVVEVTDDPWKKYSGFVIEFSDSSPYRFGMEFQNPQYNNLQIGILRKAEKSPLPADEYTSLVSIFGAASQLDWWLWYRPASPDDSFLPIPRNWGTTAEPWIQIASGELARQIEGAFKRAHDVLKECGVG